MTIIIMATSLIGQNVFFSVWKCYPQITLTRTLDAALLLVTDSARSLYTEGVIKGQAFH